MKQIFEFHCSECKETFERYVEYCKTIECEKCGGMADKIISKPTFKLEGFTGSFPGAADLWARKHIKQTAIETKKRQEHGE